MEGVQVKRWRLRLERGARALAQGEGCLADACVHAHACNGCPLQRVPYQRQLAFKQAFLAALFAGASAAPAMVAAPRRWGFRGKLELAFLGGRLGFRCRSDPRASFQVRACRLMSPLANRLAQRCARAAAEAGLEALRYLVLRRSVSLGAHAAVLVTGQGAEAGAVAAVARALLREGAAGVAWWVNASSSDVARGAERAAWGETVLEERFAGCRLRFGLGDFFQPNPLAAAQAARAIAACVERHWRVLDLYCGVGALSLPVARACARVHGVEQAGAAVARARENARLNGLVHASFEEGRVRRWLKACGEPVDAVVLDPPRAGVSKKTARRIALLGPRRVFYLSCNPVTQRRDIGWMQEEGGLEVARVTGFDFFPHTPHVECLAELAKA